MSKAHTTPTSSTGWEDVQLCLSCLSCQHLDWQRHLHVQEVQLRVPSGGAG